MRTVDDILTKARQLRADYSERDKQYQHLWYAYNGQFDKITPNYAQDDGTDRRRKQEANIQVWNLVQPIVQTKEVMINLQPGINVPAPKMGDPVAAAKAEKIERSLYALHDMGRFRRKHGQGSFNLALYYATVWQVVWDTELEIPVITVRLPGECYPVFKRNGEDVAYCVFYSSQVVDQLAEDYPQAKGLLTGRKGSSTVDVYEYIDDERRMLIVDGKTASLLPEGGEHKLGQCPVVVTPGTYILGENFPSGPCHQLIAVNDHYNRFHTKWGDALEEVLFGHHVVKSEDRPPINTGPGSVIYLRPEESYDYVQPQAPPPEAYSYLQEVRRHMRDLGTWPEVASGEMDASVITGKAVTRLQGVMAAMASEAQGNMGADLAICNSTMLKMMEVYRPKKKFVLYATAPIAPASAFDAAFGHKRPSNFAVELIPEDDIQGYYPNQLIYSPFGTDMNAAIQVGLQLVHEGVGSKRWLRNQVPSIGDAEGMEQEIKEQDRDRARFEADLQVDVQERILEAQYQQQAKLQQLAPGAAGQAPAPNTEVAPQQPGGPAPGAPPPGAAGQMVGGNAMVMPGGQPQMMGIGEPLTGKEGFPIPYTPVKPFGPALEAMTGQGGGASIGGQNQEAMPGRNVVKAEEVVSALSAATNRKGEKAAGKLKGQVYLLGEIAERGWTDGQIEIGITVKSDQQVITNALPQFAAQGLLNFRVITSVPEEAIPINTENALNTANSANTPALTGVS